MLWDMPRYEKQNKHNLLLGLFHRMELRVCLSLWWYRSDLNWVWLALFLGVSKVIENQRFLMACATKWGHYSTFIVGRVA